MAVYHTGHDAPRLTERAARVLQLAGAAASVALVVAGGVWGYRLLVRDVSGIPVVRALEGPMRQAPDNPGGEVALHTGLSVNDIAAVGEAAPPEDVLQLAPQTALLAPEDMDVALSPEAAEVMAEDLAPVPDATEGVTQVFATDMLVPDPAASSDGPMTAEQILALADQIAAGATPFSDLAGGVAVPVTLSVAGAVVADPTLALVAADVPGLARTVAPLSRPAGLSTPVVTEPAATADLPVADAIPSITLTGSIPVGTVLVQLGAYESPEIAAAEYAKLSDQFAEFLVGRERVIQAATSGGRTFYRLRATGFSDLADARRFCETLAAENTECIPVVVN